MIQQYKAQKKIPNYKRIVFIRDLLRYQKYCAEKYCSKAKRATLAMTWRFSNVSTPKLPTIFTKYQNKIILFCVYPEQVECR